MIDKRLIAACKRMDRQRATEEREEVRRLAKAMTSPNFKFYGYELEEVKRMVHQAYGRMMLAKEK